MNNRLTQTLQTVRVTISRPVPKLQIQERGSHSVTYPLDADKYLLGRSRSQCDIQVQSPLASSVHLSLTRDNRHPESFFLKDQGSTNGTYKQGKPCNGKPIPLQHGDRLYLGPPDHQESVRLQYICPPSLPMRALKAVRTGLLAGVGTLAGTSLIGAAIAGVWLANEWRKFEVRPLPLGIQGPTVVYSEDGQPLRPSQPQHHVELKRLEDFDADLRNALLASEDSRFYWHPGIDPIGIARAIQINRQAGETVQGASTITQQLARTLYPEYVGRENTADRKLREIAVALRLELAYSKDEILRTYMNRVYLGVGLNGFDDAARFYYDKSATDLTVAEAATLVAILPAPNKYNPVRDKATAQGLRNRVLERMVAQGKLNPDEAFRARRTPIDAGLSPKAIATFTSTLAPYFYQRVFVELREILGAELAAEGNFLVETGLDLQLQKQAEAALKRGVNELGSRYRFGQGAIVTLNTRTGEALAIAGGTDYAVSQFDRATQARRQPGSTFKVFAYAAALDAGFSPAKTYSCAPVTWGGQRYGGCERSGGNITMTRALVQSENSPSLRVARDAGLHNVVKMARRLGITTKLEPVPGLVLGQYEVSLLELTAAYATFTNEGKWNRGHLIRRIRDGHDCEDNNNWQTCRVIYDFNERPAERNVEQLSPEVARAMTQMMQGVVRSGTGRRAYMGGQEAGKTGTTDDNIDLWFVGFVPEREMVTGVWLGNDDNSPTRGSSSEAARVWRDYMR